MSRIAYQHSLSVSALIAEDMSYAELRVYRYYTDGTAESHGIVLTPADFDVEADLRDLMREVMQGIAEQL